MGMTRTVAAVFGVIYVLAGALAFVLVEGGEGAFFDLFDVNALHNIVHIVLGAILLYGAMSTAAAIMTTRLVGVILLVVGVLGFVDPEGFGLMPIGGNDIWLHLATGAILLVVGLMGGSEAA